MVNRYIEWCVCVCSFSVAVSVVVLVACAQRQRGQFAESSTHAMLEELLLGQNKMFSRLLFYNYIIYYTYACSVRGEYMPWPYFFKSYADSFSTYIRLCIRKSKLIDHLFENVIIIFCRENSGVRGMKWLHNSSHEYGKHVISTTSTFRVDGAPGELCWFLIEL